MVRTDGTRKKNRGLWRLLFRDPMDQALPEADGCEDLGRLEEKYSYRLVNIQKTIEHHHAING